MGAEKGDDPVAEKKTGKSVDYDALTGSILKASLRITAAIIVVGLLYVCIVKSYSFGYQIFQDEPYHPDSTRSVSVTVPEGCTTLEMGEALEHADIIENAWVFTIQSQLYGYSIQPGNHTISDAMTTKEILKVLSEKQIQGQ